MSAASETRMGFVVLEHSSILCPADGSHSVGPGVVSGTVCSFFLICLWGLCHSCLDSTILAQTQCSAPRDNLCLAHGAYTNE